MTHRPHIAVIGGIRETQDRLNALGYRVSCFMSRNNLMASDRRRQWARLFIFDRLDNVGEVGAVLTAVHRHDPFVGIYAFHDETQLLAAELAAQIGLPPHYKKATVFNTRNKYQMRLALAAAELSAVAFELATGVDDVARFFDSHPDIDAIICKPVAGTGSENVRRISRADGNLTDVKHHLADQVFPILVEEYVAGPEYSVEAFSHHGEHFVLAVTEKFVDSETFIEAGHLVPARLDQAVASTIKAETERFLSALGVENGPSHTEIKLVDGRAVLIETHTRVAGDCIPLLVKLATGADLHQLSALQVAGYTLPVEALRAPCAQQHVAVKFHVQSGGSRPITEITGLDAARRSPGVIEAHCHYALGDRLRAVRHSFDRAAHVVAQGSDAEEALHRADSALAKIGFGFADEDSTP